MINQDTKFPATRASLLLQLKSGDDEAAWHDFVTTYRPVIYRIARKRGLQDADAQDLAQKILISVANALPSWEPREARFRHWLRRVTRNAVLNQLTRRPKDAAVGGTAALELLADQSSGEADKLDYEFTLEYRRELYFRAAAMVQAEVAAESWQVFQLAVIENSPIEDVAQQTGKSIGAAYACRGRVMNRLRSTVKQLEENAE